MSKGWDIQALIRTAAVAVVVGWIAPALADVSAENAGAQRYLGKLEQRMKCPEPVFRKVQQAIDGPDLPPHLQATKTARQQMRLVFFVEYFKQMPAMQQQMVLGMPGALQSVAAQVDLPADQLRAALSSGSVAVPKPAQFMSRRSADVSLHSELGAACDARCLMNLRWSLVSSLAIWKTVCLTCSDDFMLAVAVDGYLWLDRRVLKWLQDAPSVTPAQFPFRSESNAVRSRVNPQAYGMAPNAPNALSQPMGIQPLERVEASHPAVKRACMAPAPVGQESDVLLRIQELACGAGSTTHKSTAARLQLHLKSGATSCGPSDAFLGCGRPDNTIEITFDKTRYTFMNVFGAEDAVIGLGGEPPLSGMAVMAHEVGHWFGLPHLGFKPDEIPDMMQDTYIDEACGSELNLLLMSNMSDQAHADRFRVGGGYRRKK